MRVALAACAAIAAYAALADVTYLNSGGSAGDWPEHRRIEVVSQPECLRILDRAKLTLGDDGAIRCERVPLYRHWANLVRSAYEDGGAANLAKLMLGGEAVASVASPDTLR